MKINSSVRYLTGFLWVTAEIRAQHKPPSVCFSNHNMGGADARRIDAGRTHEKPVPMSLPDYIPRISTFPTYVARMFRKLSRTSFLYGLTCLKAGSKVT